MSYRYLRRIDGKTRKDRIETRDNQQQYKILEGQLKGFEHVCSMTKVRTKKRNKKQTVKEETRKVKNKMDKRYKR